MTKKGVDCFGDSPKSPRNDESTPRCHIARANRRFTQSNPNLKFHHIPKGESIRIFDFIARAGAKVRNRIALRGHYKVWRSGIISQHGEFRHHFKSVSYVGRGRCARTPTLREIIATTNPTLNSRLLKKYHSHTRAKIHI